MFPQANKFSSQSVHSLETKQRKHESMPKNTDIIALPSNNTTTKGKTRTMKRHNVM